VPKAIADEDIISGQVLLVDEVTESVFAEPLAAVGAVVHDGAVQCSAEAILDGADFS